MMLTARGSHQGLRCDVVARIIRGARTVNMVGSGIATVQSTAFICQLLSTDTLGAHRVCVIFCQDVGSLTLRPRSPGPRAVVTGTRARITPRKHAQLQTTSTKRHSAQALDAKRQCAARPPTRDLRAGTRSYRSVIEPPQTVRLDGLCPAALLPPFCKAAAKRPAA